MLTPIGEEQRMMNDAVIGWPELDGAHEAIVREIHRHNEALVHVLSFRRNLKRLA